MEIKTCPFCSGLYFDYNRHAELNHTKHELRCISYNSHRVYDEKHSCICNNRLAGEKYFTKQDSNQSLEQVN